MRAVRSVVLVTPIPSNAIENVRAAAELDEVRMLDVAQELPATGIDRVHELVGRLIVEAQLPVLGTLCCDRYEANGGIVVRYPDTEVVIAATRTITETIASEYG